MQLFLIVISIPLLLLAAVVQERRQAEQAARQSAEHLTLALDAAQMGTWDWNIADDTVTWSTESRKIFGLTETDRDIDFNLFLSRVHPDDRAGVSEAVTRAIEQSENYEREFRVVRPDGSLRWVMGKGKVLCDDQGRPLHMSGVNLDVTDRKRAERDVQEQRQQLAHLGRVAVLGELSGALAHELSQPLTAILSNVQAGQALLGGTRVDLGELGEILADIAQDDRRAGEVIHRLRAMFRKGEDNLQSLDVHGIVRDVLDLAHSDLVTRHVTVTTDLASGLPNVRGDSVQLQQVLLNLIMNASEAMGANKPSDRAMLIKTAGVNGDVVISVVDNGSGIPAESVEKLFEPFFTTKAQGLGLGLAICRSIVVAHGGGLSAINNRDRGATFQLSLPPEGRNVD
jgi:PAS domain S-box-containing protein